MAFSGGAALAACTLPHELSNGELGDARQMMANFNALVDCLAGIVPGGATDTVQYNSSTGGFAGAGPLTDGQIVGGSPAGALQVQNLAPGNGIAVTNTAGHIAISTSTRDGGLYSQVMSATPTAATTGLTNWLNQGSAVVNDSAVGICIDAPSSGASENVTGRYKASPTPPYKITVLVASTRNSSRNNSIGVGWYDGTAKMQTITYTTNNSGAGRFYVSMWSSVTSYFGSNFSGDNNAVAQPIWLQIADSGTTVSFAFSNDGSNFVTLYSVSKSAGYLGSSGYANVLFFINPQQSRTLGTLMSWTQQ